MKEIPWMKVHTPQEQKMQEFLWWQDYAPKRCSGDKKISPVSKLKLNIRNMETEIKSIRSGMPQSAKPL